MPLTNLTLPTPRGRQFGTNGGSGTFQACAAVGIHPGLSEFGTGGARAQTDNGTVRGFVIRDANLPETAQMDDVR